MTVATRMFSAVLVVLGVTMVVVTAAAGGGMRPAFGYLMGAALALAGGLRYYLTISRSGAKSNG
jgi:hypothetical protein